MRRVVLPLLGLGCFLGLLLVIYRPVLLGDGQFAWDNASYLYYPLYLRVQQEWESGRWPLWDPGQNGGEPLLGNPITAVLYPGKILYACLTYAWGARLYVIVHTIIAFLGMLALGRSLGVGWLGSYLGGLSYAFGAPVLFLYCNVVFQVGAAWLPWGLCALDRLLRKRRLWAVAETALILALQVFGGDPEAAYLTSLCGAVYAVILAMSTGSTRLNVRSGWLIVLGLGFLWVAGSFGLAARHGDAAGVLRPRWTILAIWLAVGVGITWSWLRHRSQAVLGPLLARLASASVLALAIAAVQALPALEFAGQSWRAAGISSQTAHRYSLNPVRIVELVWPNFFGTSTLSNRSWLQAVPPAGEHELWVDSLYMGGLTVILALGACGWRGGPPWRAWLTTILLLGLAGSFGKYASPLWWARWGPLHSVLGPHDTSFGRGPGDGFLSDGATSPYGLLAALLPGFDTFRYPSKLLPLAAVSLAMLAGAGWNGLVDNSATSRRIRPVGMVALGLSLLGLILAVASRGRAVSFLSGRIPFNMALGRADVAGAWTDTQWALAQGTLMFSATLLIAHWVSRRRSVAGALAILLLASDLAVANARLIWTVPQALFDARAEAALLIEEAERADPSPGPYRIHRMTGSYPLHFATSTATDRSLELTLWARATLHPLFALPLGLEYCATTGTLQLDDHAAYFSPQMMPVPDEMARVLGIRPGEPVAYHPRRSFDLWAARYFILPALPEWGNPTRGYASFLDKTDLVYPSAVVLYESQSGKGAEPWGIRQDWQLRRNRAAFPRAWIVHHARLRPVASDAESRARLMKTLVFMNDPIWREPGRPVLDLRQSALIETNDPESLETFISRTPVGPTEQVVVTVHEPQRVELTVSMDLPGMVILAGTYYPGWRLKIDGQPAPILRANRLMRGAAVASGTHKLVYTYEPASFRRGAIISLSSLIVLLFFAAVFWRALILPERKVYAARGMET